MHKCQSELFINPSKLSTDRLILNDVMKTVNFSTRVAVAILDIHTYILVNLFSSVETNITRSNSNFITTE